MHNLKKLANYFLIFCLLGSSVPVYSNNQLPDIGTAAASTLTINQELEYGDAYMRMLRASKPIVSDPLLNEYVQSLGHSLVANANDVKTPFHFFLIQDREINAFAFFGGYVALHTGLFLHAKSESELASVVAHEIAHITQRHLARSMEAQAKRSPVTMAALVGSLLLAIAAPEAGIAAIQATTAGAMQSSINYTRSNEKEADRFGIATLAKSGFEVNAMPRFFGRLADQYRYASTPPQMLLTHPLPEARITDSRERAQQYPEKRVKTSLRYQLARARIVARYANIESAAALDSFSRQLKKANKTQKVALEYGKALVFIDTGKLEQAKVILDSLLQQSPDNTFYIDAATDLDLARDKNEQAIKRLETALTQTPNNAVLIINYANALLEDQQPEKAMKILQRYTHEQKMDPIGWQLLAKAYNDQGILDGELAARAEIFALRASWNKALQNYTQASQLAELGSLNQARYDARIDELRADRERFTAL
ncbi:beta-barrel assembly-enhancing protease [Aliivibrio kagoshimensis]|uniref:beta-barrel assembly-enhancing protease n=1 Tax=Aliivibrio kagoshimensis TaxID=2910230 RepID=UPI003D0E09CE